MGLIWDEDRMPDEPDLLEPLEDVFLEDECPECGWPLAVCECEDEDAEFDLEPGADS